MDFETKMIILAFLVLGIVLMISVIKDHIDQVASKNNDQWNHWYHDYHQQRIYDDRSDDDAYMH